jgi:epoxyqueuosine reductase QueG
MDLGSEMRTQARTLGADYFGIADIAAVKDELAAQGYPLAQSYRHAVALGMRVVNTIVDELDPQAGFPTLQLYRQFCYDTINQRLDAIASQLAALLQAQGHDCLPVPASPSTIDNGRLYGAFSNKAAAHLAGLGWIGKSCLLITPDAGPRVRWATVLTNAPLAHCGKPTEGRCGDCQQCVDACPSRAFTGKPFRSNEPREVRYDAWKCNEYLKSVEVKHGVRVCGMCVKVCPYGRKRPTIMMKAVV